MEKLVYKYERFIKALKSLEKIKNKVENPPSYADQDDLDSYMTTLIKRFEYTFEILWKFLKEYLRVKYGIKTLGSKDVLRKCYEYKLFSEQETELLLDAVEDRNATAHDYDGEIAQVLSAKIVKVYFPLIQEISKGMQGDEKDQHSKPTIKTEDITDREVEIREIADRIMKKYDPVFEKLSKT